MVKRFLLLLVIVVAGARFSKLFNRPNFPDTTVDEVLAQAAEKEAARQQEKEQFLSDMSTIESSSGQNLEHKKLQGGMHAGQRAVGRFGFMPKTIKEMTKRMGDEAPSGLNALSEIKDEQEMANLVAEDPELEQAVADEMYEHVEKRFETPEQRNLSWELGHNMSPAKIKQKVEGHPRTEKFRKLRKVTTKND